MEKLYLKLLWVISKKLNGDTQKIISETKNNVSKMIEHEFKDFAGQPVSLRMKTRLVLVILNYFTMKIVGIMMYLALYTRDDLI